MAKRFTGTEKWGKRFFRSLKPAYKLLWLLILDECDTAGIWEVDMQVAEIKIGAKINEKEAILCFGEKITLIDGGSKWFIPTFIEFQYGELSENNRAHTKAIFTLKKFDLLSDDFKIKPLSKPLTSPLQGAMDMVEDKEEDKDKEKEMDKGAQIKKNEILVMPFSSQEFTDMWNRWKTYKLEQLKFTYKSTTTEQAALNELTKISKGVESEAIAIILQSIANGWKGFFELKSSNNGTGNSKNNQSDFNSHKQQLARRMGFTSNQS